MKRNGYSCNFRGTNGRGRGKEEAHGEARESHVLVWLEGAKGRNECCMEGKG